LTTTSHLSLHAVVVAYDTVAAFEREKTRSSRTAAFEGSRPATCSAFAGGHLLIEAREEPTTVLSAPDDLNKDEEKKMGFRVDRSSRTAAKGNKWRAQSRAWLHRHEEVKTKLTASGEKRSNSKERKIDLDPPPRDHLPPRVFRLDSQLDHSFQPNLSSSRRHRRRTGLSSSTGSSFFRRPEEKKAASFLPFPRRRTTPSSLIAAASTFLLPAGAQRRRPLRPEAEVEGTREFSSPAATLCSLFCIFPYSEG
jgi:hypothetical protein